MTLQRSDDHRILWFPCFCFDEFRRTVDEYLVEVGGVGAAVPFLAGAVQEDQQWILWSFFGISGRSVDVITIWRCIGPEFVGGMFSACICGQAFEIGEGRGIVAAA